MMFTRLIPCLLMLVSCSHDAQRQNPLDARLTSAVELSVAVDDTAGSVVLRWSAYESQTPFARYLVLRQISDRRTVDTLAVVQQQEQTVFSDSSIDPDVVYVYRVSVVNSAGLEVSSNEMRAGPVGLPSIDITSVTSDAPAASATIEWSRYHGPDFRSYNVFRGVGADSRLVAQIDLVDSTRLVDVGLRGNEDYLYRVVVTTTDGHVVQSSQQATKIHPWLASWPLDSQGNNAELESVRLAPAQDGGLVAQISDDQSIRLATFDANGTVLEDATPLQWTTTQRTRASRYSTSVDGDGRWLGLVYGDIDEELGVSYGVVRLVNGRLEEQTVQLQLPVLPAQERPPAATVSLEARWACFDGVRVYDANSTLFEEGFSFLSGVSRSIETINGWAFQDLHVTVQDRLCLQGSPAVARRSDMAWVDFGIEAEVTLLARSPGSAVIAIGDSLAGRLELSLDLERDPFVDFQPTANFIWSYRDPSDPTASPRTEATSASFKVLPWLYSVRTSIDLLDSTPMATVAYPRLFLQGAADNDQVTWTTLTSVRDQMAFTAGNLAYAIDAAGTTQVLTPFSSQVSEMRAWTPEGESQPHVVVCLPEEDQVRTGRVFGSRWRDALTTTIGPRLGEAGGRLFWPVSVAVGPDGRMYILDAGNHRIVVVNASGQYITEFGLAGSADGEFNFGSDTRLPGGLDFGGSIAIDADGFIYVADTRNRRVQKFAP